MTEGKGKQPKPYPLRMEKGLKEWLFGRAKRSNRSVNCEVITILEREKAKESEESEEAEKQKA